MLPILKLVLPHLPPDASFLELLVGIFPYTITSILTPLNAGCQLIVDHKTTMCAGDISIRGENLDLPSTIRAVPDLERRCANVGYSRTNVGFAHL